MLDTGSRLDSNPRQSMQPAGDTRKFKCQLANLPILTIKLEVFQGDNELTDKKNKTLAQEQEKSSFILNCPHYLASQ